MKNSKKGISLIVLVITIIVIIILAAAVLLSIQNNNPIDNATEAKNASNLDAAQSAFNILIGKVMADCQTSVEIKGTSLVGVTFEADGKKVNKNGDKFELTEAGGYSVSESDLGFKTGDLEGYTINATTGVVSAPVTGSGE